METAVPVLKASRSLLVNGTHWVPGVHSPQLSRSCLPLPQVPFTPGQAPESPKAPSEGQHSHRKCQAAPSGKGDEFDIIVGGQLSIPSEINGTKSGPRAGLAASVAPAAPLGGTLHLPEGFP